MPLSGHSHVDQGPGRGRCPMPRIARAIGPRWPRCSLRIGLRPHPLPRPVAPSLQCPPKRAAPPPPPCPGPYGTLFTPGPSDPSARPGQRSPPGVCACCHWPHMAPAGQAAQGLWVGAHPLGGGGIPGGVRKRGGVFLNGSLAKRPCVAHMFNHGWWRLAVGGGWRLVVGGDWRLVAIGGWWLVAIGGWRRLAVGGWWRLAVGGPLGRSLRAVLNQKKIQSPKGPPGANRRRLLGAGPDRLTHPLRQQP